MKVGVKDAVWLIGLFALAVSIGINVRLYRERSQSARPRPALEPGASVAPFSARNVAEGRVERVDFDGSRPTALYVFSSRCGWCDRNAESIRSLAQQGQGKFRFVGLALSDPGEGGQTDLPFPVYANLDEATRKAYKLGSTPQMIVVAPDGRVLKTWTGAFVSPAEEEIERYFGVQLPAIPLPIS